MYRILNNARPDQTLAIDDDTGLLWVGSYSESTFTPAAEVKLSFDGATGLQTTLTSIETATEATETATQNVDYVVSASYSATLGASANLPTKFSTGALPAALVRVILVPQSGDQFYKIGGAASGTTQKIPAGGISIPITATLAATTCVYAASGIVCDLLVCIPRN